MANILCVNKSGVSIPVYSDPQKTAVVGAIYNREAFVYNEGWGGDLYLFAIYFLNASNQWATGFLVDPPVNGVMDCYDYPNQSVSGPNSSCKPFVMRSTKTIYMANLNNDGSFAPYVTVSAGQYVASYNSTNGDNFPYLKEIHYYRTASGTWIPTNYTQNGVSYNYGYIDTGIRSGSGYSNIALYGSW